MVGEAVEIVVRLDVDYWRPMNQISARNENRLILYLVKFGHAQAYGVVSVGTSCGKDAFLFSLELWRSNFGFLVIVVVEANVEDEDQPYVPIVLQTLQAARINFVD